MDMKTHARQLAALAIQENWNLEKLYEAEQFNFTLGQQEYMYQVVSLALEIIEEYWYRQFERNAI